MHGRFGLSPWEISEPTAWSLRVRTDQPPLGPCGARGVVPRAGRVDDPVDPPEVPRVVAGPTARGVWSVPSADPIAEIAECRPRRVPRDSFESCPAGA